MLAATIAMALLRLALRFELGPELDTNANHAPQSPPSGLAPPIESFLLRGAARGRLAYKSDRHTLRLTLDLGGKVFFAGAAQPQDAIALRLALEERTQLSKRVALGVAAEYHDVFQPIACPDVTFTDGSGQTQSLADTSCHRDFRVGGARALVSLAGERLGLAAEAGARGYEWKPDEDLSFFGVGGALTPSLRLPGARRAEGERDEWTLSATGRAEWRRFSGRALQDPNEVPASDEGGLAREDTVGSFGVSLAWSGPLLASAGYLVERSTSNSAGADYLYQAVTLALTTPLPGGVFAAARAKLLFFSSGTLPASLSVEDENRDSVLVDLSREIARGFTARLRYAVYRNAASDLLGGYLRQTVFAGASWEMR